MMQIRFKFQISCWVIAVSPDNNIEAISFLSTIIENKFLKVWFFFITPSLPTGGNTKKSVGQTKLLKQIPWMEKTLVGQ